MNRLEQKRRLQLRFYERLTLLRAVSVVVLVALALTFGAALLVRLVEPDTFTSFGDALWWAVATVSSTGYGDLAPETGAGRAVGATVMVTALTLVPAITAVVTALLVRKREEELRIVPPAHPDELHELLERLHRLARAETGNVADASARRRS